MTAPAPASVPAPLEPVVAPFTVAVDHREHLPYAFPALATDAKDRRRPLVVPTVRRHLPTGDYTIDGLDPTGRPWAERVAVERKSLADLYGTVGRGRARFERELARLDALQVAWVMVEAEWTEILAGPPDRCELPPKVIARSVGAWEIKFPRVHWRTMPGRAVAEAVTYRLLEKFHREHVGRKQEYRLWRA